MHSLALIRQALLTYITGTCVFSQTYKSVIKVYVSTVDSGQSHTTHTRHIIFECDTLHSLLSSHSLSHIFNGFPFFVLLIVWYYVFALHLADRKSYVQMDDDSCVLKYIEIVPLDNNAEHTEDIKPFQVKVCNITKLVA